MADRLKQGQTASVRTETKADKTIIMQLAEKAKQGDSDALYSLCQAIASSVLFRMTCRMSPVDAEDAAQDALLIVCTNIHALKDSKAFYGWLNSIIVHEISLHTAKNTRNADVVNIDDFIENMVEENEAFLPDECAIKEEDRKIIMDIVKQLPDRQAEAVMLHYYDGMTITETADTMGVTRQNVNGYLVLARKKIKNGIQKLARSSSSLYSLSLLPMGAVLTQVLHDEAALLPPVNEAIITKIVNSSSASKVGSSVKGTAVGAFLLSALPAIFISFMASLALVGGLLVAGVIPFVRNDSDERLESIAADATGDIVFSGGDSAYPYINPKQATVLTESSHGELVIQDWSISTQGGIIISSGEGNSANAALTELSHSGQDGKYILVFTLMDATGCPYTLSHSFYILRDNSSI